MEMWTQQLTNPWKCKTFLCAWTEDISISNSTAASLEREGQTSWQMPCQLWGSACPQHIFHWDASRHSAVRLIQSRWPSTWILSIPPCSRGRVSSAAQDGCDEARGQVLFSLCPTLVTMKHILVASTQRSWWRGRYKGFIHLLWPVTKRQMHQITGGWMKGQRKRELEQV